MSELDDIISEPVTVKAGGQDIVVRPMTPVRVARFARALKPMAGEIPTDLGKLDRQAMVALFADHGEDMIEAVAAATGLEPEFVGEQCQMDELLELAATVFQVNADFFALRLAPAIRRFVQSAGARSSNGAGRTPSSCSSATATN